MTDRQSMFTVATCPVEGCIQVDSGYHRQFGHPLPNPNKMYVIVREDISPGQQAVQAAHALANFAGTYPSQFLDWNRGSNTLVILAVPNEHILLVHKWVTYDMDLKVSLFREPDMEFEATALAIEPHASNNLWLAHLPLALRKRRWWQRKTHA